MTETLEFEPEGDVVTNSYLKCTQCNVDIDEAIAKDKFTLYKTAELVVDWVRTGEANIMRYQKKIGLTQIE